jgi:GxxExxY protein
MLDAARTVHKRLGKRQSIESYEAGLAEELRLRGIGIRGDGNTRILYGGSSVGVYLADILVEGDTLIEIKRAERLTEEEKRSFDRFVRDMKWQRGYLINFAGDDLEVATFPAE